MKTSTVITAILLCITPQFIFAQIQPPPPDLGAAESFVVFTAVGALTNVGASRIIGDIGSDVGGVTGFPPGVIIGSIHDANSTSAAVAVAVCNAYAYLFGISGGTAIATGLGGGQILTPDVYILGAASTLSGELILDAEDNPDAIFIFQIDGAFATSTNSQVTLINGAQFSNVYWQISGATTLAEGSAFQGTIIGNGAIHVLEAATLQGRTLTCAGAIDLHNTDITNTLLIAAIITADGPTTFCIGDSVTLSGNIDGVWNTGDSSATIVVTVSGEYFVTNSDGFNDVISNIITVTVNLLPICSITGDLNICDGQSTELCASAGADTYEWSTGATTNCITVSTSGTYSVTITDTNGCTSECEATVMADTLQTCTITGDRSICEGQFTELCVPAGAAFYIWSTGAITNCISVNTSGVYSVTVTDTNGCTHECMAEVTSSSTSSCTITGDLSICNGQFTDLCVPPGAASYIWNTGETTNCITVGTAGSYTVTVTETDGCVSVCSATVNTSTLPLCNITGNLSVCEGQSTVLCAIEGAVSYTWSTGETSHCIVVDSTGTFSVTVTDANGCITECSATVFVNPTPICAIEGENVLCNGASTDLCVPAGAVSYLWNTGAITNCINVNAPGLYSVTITHLGGCLSVCSQVVTTNPPPACSIEGTDIECNEESTELCAIPGAFAYIWNTGATTSCIIVSTAGLYTVTITDANGCNSVCSQTVVVYVEAPPIISCPTDVTIDCQDSTLPANTGTATAPINCDITAVISYSDAVSASLCPESFLITRTWTATYGVGNSISCTQAIVVEDNTPPVLVCPADMTIECDESSLPSNTGIATSTDNCSTTSSVTYSDLVTANDCIEGTTINRTWQATDECGNLSTCVQVITLLDNTPPVITIVNPLLSAHGDTTYVHCFGQNPLWSLPVFNENSVVANDNCSVAVEIGYTQTLVSEGNCKEDGYILLYLLTWTATDDCGNSSSAFVYYALIDTTPPVIHGVPEDITVHCSDIPEVPFEIYATDECLCACLVFMEETTRPDGCLNGTVILRTWTAMDDCGNIAVATQRITIIDDQGPELLIIHPELAGMPDGTILEYACSEGGKPGFFSFMGTHSVAIIESACGGIGSVTFALTIDSDINCALYGYKEELRYEWVAIDECGQATSLTIFVRLIADEAPILIGVPDFMTCFSDPALDNVYAIDRCEGGSNQFTFTHYWDVEVQNPCADGTAIMRTYEAYDNCGNSVRDSVLLIHDDFNSPAIEFIDPAMEAFGAGEFMVINCNSSGIRYTSYGPKDVMLTDECTIGMTIIFEERLISTEDCTVNNIVSIVELKWTATDVCGNAAERIILAQIVDNTRPVFVNLQPSITIGCEDSMPAIIAIDNCGEVVITTRDSIVHGDCEFEYIIHREITATDPCNNSITRNQIIIVGDGSGPIITGVEENICDDLSIPEVTAYDACIDEQIEVQMVQDTLSTICRDGFIIRRTWTAVNICGHQTVITQNIIMHNHATPEIVPIAPIFSDIMNPNQRLIYLSNSELIDQLNALNERSVLVRDACGLEINPVLTVFSSTGNCEEDGYSERRIYIWVATDICGNSSSLFVTVDIMDDVPPEMLDVPGDTTIICVELPNPPTMLIDSLDNWTIEFTEDMIAGVNPNEFIVTRTWTAIDSCGNISIRSQRITWIQNTDLLCEIIVPENISCNTHDVHIGSIFSGDAGEYIYDWEIVGDKCFIQGGQGTPDIRIYIGWGTVKITLTITDAYGCVSMCMIELECDLFESRLATSSEQINTLDIGLDPDENAVLSNLMMFPNPASESVNIRFESKINHDVTLTCTNLHGQILVRDEYAAQVGVNNHLMNLNHLLPGTYVIRMKTEHEVLSKMIVVIPNN